MKVLLAAIGRLKDSGERELFDRYAGRFDAAGRGVALGPLTVVDFPESRAADAASRKAEEGQRLLKCASGASAVIVLDETGTIESSADFARRLAKLRDDGAASIALLIGGPDGHGADVKTSARTSLSLGRMTLPHGLARVVLAEQLYRAVTILSGHPYHRA